MEAKYRLVTTWPEDSVQVRDRTSNEILVEMKPHELVTMKNTFDQARGSMRELYEFFIQNHENVGLELYGRVNGKDLTPSAQRLNELLDKMNDVLAAMEATHEL